MKNLHNFRKLQFNSLTLGTKKTCKTYKNCVFNSLMLIIGYLTHDLIKYVAKR